jgi:drug/metabolite transporter (DMT)-like permease
VKLFPFTPFRAADAAHAILPRPSRPVLAVAALVGANALWGGSAVATKAALAHLPPLTLACLRVAIAFAVLWPLLARTGRRPATGRTPALLGLTGVALFCGCQNLGLLYASATTAALVNGGIPVLTALLAAASLGERLGGRRLTGLLVALAGIAGVVLGDPRPDGGASVLGAALPLLSAVSFAVYAVLGRRAFGGGDALAIVAGSTRYGLLLLLPVAFVELWTGGFEPPTGGDGLLLLYLGAGCSALAFVLCGYGLAHLEAGHGAVFGNLKPLVGFALAVVVLGEPATASQVGGGALALIGAGLASVRPGPASTRTAPYRSRRGPRPRGQAHPSPVDLVTARDRAYRTTPWRPGPG